MPRYFQIDDSARAVVTELPRLWIEYKENEMWKKRFYIMSFINGHDHIRFGVYGHGINWVGGWNMPLDEAVKSLEEKIGLTIPEDAKDNLEAILLEQKMTGDSGYKI